MENRRSPFPSGVCVCVCVCDLWRRPGSPSQEGGLGGQDGDDGWWDGSTKPSIQSKRLAQRPSDVRKCITQARVLPLVNTARLSTVHFCMSQALLDGNVRTGRTCVSWQDPNYRSAPSRVLSCGPGRHCQDWDSPVPHQRTPRAELTGEEWRLLPDLYT